MQLIPRYLVDNKITIVANEAGFVTEYRPVYTRQVKLYKGIDNVVQFKLVNADQKPIDVDMYTPKFVAFDENQNMIIERDCVNLQEGDSTGYTNKGLCQVTITENDLLNVNQQFLSYNVYLVDPDSNKVLTYVNSHFDNNGIMYVSGDAFPGPLATYNIITFTEDNGLAGEDDSVWYSESLDAQPGINGNDALHTAVIYTSSYVGDVVVQATLENQITGTTSWADITTVTFTGSETEPTPVNFNGVFSHLRFKSTANPTDKISKILVRN
jgi:hypothetical protein